jgi:hypothetical protein
LHCIHGNVIFGPASCQHALSDEPKKQLLLNTWRCYIHASDRKHVVLLHCQQLVTPSEARGDSFRTGSERSEASCTADSVKRGRQPAAGTHNGANGAHHNHLEQQQDAQKHARSKGLHGADDDDAKAAAKAARRQARKMSKQKGRKDDGCEEQSSEAATVAETPDSHSGKPFTHSPPR